MPIDQGQPDGGLGMPMVGGIGGVDVDGNTWGTDSDHQGQKKRARSPRISSDILGKCTTNSEQLATF